MCGGTSAGICQGVLPGGLSPRVRGNPTPPSDAPEGRRSIPACAGEPDSPARITPAERVYPRVCGGTVNAGAGRPGRGGLSPRVRGNLIPAVTQMNDFGSIPACAGEPHRRNCSSYCPSVYPRVCGGTDGSPQHVHRVAGLSPRVRGNPLPPLPAKVAPRSIPACAGEPPQARRDGYNIPVYPRVCGGTGVPGDGVLPRQGLSPRVRGNRLLWRVGVADRGSIPACAGEPPARTR